MIAFSCSANHKFRLGCGLKAYRRLRWKRFRVLVSMLPSSGLSVTFLYCAQTAEDADTISSAFDSPMSLPYRVKIWLTAFNPFLPKFYPVTHPCWFECRRYSMANCSRMDSAMVTMESL